MWDLRGASPFGRLSIRKYLLCATALVVAILAYILLNAPVTHAADAQWKGDAITYNNQTYIALTDPPAAVPSGSKAYASIDPAPPTPGNGTRKAHIIYFAPGADPGAATTATYTTYDFTPPNDFANPTDKKQITLDPQPDGTKGTTSCDSTFTLGIGWIVCPVTNFLAGAMDWLFQILSSFLTVRPVQTDQNNALYRAWSIMRNFANVAFVIAFLVVIYSQLSNVGLSNYNVKKMLPRLIIAAILVNISYWICAVAIDVSNILGYSIQDIFIAMRNNLVGPEGNGWDISWKTMTGFVLSGGTAAVAGGIGLYAAVAGAGGAIYLLLPILVGVLMAVLVALLVLAARQALITVLVILAPLAFVAYLLPNTEKYFKKWYELGSTMLIMFPLFSIIFGGSQLAGLAIIQNADSINLIILGMGVQVAPVVVTPLLVRFSGSLLGRIAGLVNNPNKGLIDRTRKWSQERADQHKDRAIANGTGRMARGARFIDNRRRKREGWQKANQATSEANWRGTKDYSNIQQRAMDAALAQEGHEAAVQERYERYKHTNAAVQGLDITARANKLKLDLSKATTEANWEEIRAGHIGSVVTPAGLATGALGNYRRQQQSMADQIQHNTLESAIEARRAHSAKHEQQQHFAQSLLDSEALQVRAGGIDATGADAALAAAIAEKRKDYGQSVDDAHQILKHLNLSGAERQQLAMSGDLDIVRNGQVVKRFNTDSIHAREAAIEAQIRGEGNFKQIEEIILASGSSLSNFKTTIGDEINKNKLSEKAAYLGGKTIDQIKQGDIKGNVELDMAVARTIAQGKIKPIQMATMDVDAVRRVRMVAQSGSTAGLSREDATALKDQITALGVSAQEALTNPSLRGQSAKNVKDELQEFVRLWPPNPNNP